MTLVTIDHTLLGTLPTNDSGFTVPANFAVILCSEPRS